MEQESRVRGKVERPGLAACVLRPGTLVLGGLRILLFAAEDSDSPGPGSETCQAQLPCFWKLCPPVCMSNLPPPPTKGSWAVVERLPGCVRRSGFAFTSPKVINLSQEMKRVLKNQH